MSSMIEITEEPIDIGAVVSSVRHPGAGAVVTFLGTVRDHDEAGRVVALAYEAYAPMAVAQMKAIAGEIADRWGIDHVSIVHRVGRLEVGDVAVVIAVSSPHRAEAFEACRYAIDRIKEIVPIWKKELYPHGSEWKQA